MEYDSHSDKAIFAALEMRKSLVLLNKARVKKGLQTFSHGIGIHTGEVLAGNGGSEDRLSYTLIGDTVNLASRIQELTKEFLCDILVSEETVKRLENAFQILPLICRGGLVVPPLHRRREVWVVRRVVGPAVPSPAPPASHPSASAHSPAPAHPPRARVRVSWHSIA